MSTLVPSYPPNATKTQRGLVSTEEQEIAGEKTFVAQKTTINDTLVVGADWEAEADIEGSPITLIGLPIHLGGFGGDVAEFLATPGLRRYSVEGFGTDFMELGTEDCRLSFNLNDNEIEIHASQVYVPSAHVDELTTGDFTSTSADVGSLTATSADLGSLLVGGSPVGATPPADATTDGVVTTGDQVLGGPASTKTFANIVVSTLATLAAIATNLVRAVAATLVLRSTLGAGSSDVGVELGVEPADASVHGSAKLLRVVTGSGGTPVEKFIVTKAGPAVGANTAMEFNGPGGGCRVIFTSGNGILGFQNAAGSAYLGLFPGTSHAGCSGNFTAQGGMTCFGALYAAGNVIGDSGGSPRITWPGGQPTMSLQSPLGAGDAVAIGCFALDATILSTNPNLKIASFRTGNGSSLTVTKAFVTARGTYGSGVIQDPGSGNATINAEKGRAGVKNGNASVVVTNDQVTADSVVLLSWELWPQFSGAPLDFEVAINPLGGDFTVTVMDRTGGGAVPVDFDTYFRFKVFQ